MLELERLIEAAVSDASLPDIARVDRIVRRRRRRRAIAKAAAGGAIIVAVAAILFVPRYAPTSQVTTRGTAAPTTPPTVATVTDLSVTDLQRALSSQGHVLRVEPRSGGSGVLGVAPTLLCVDGVRAVQVYEYSSDAARSGWSRAVSRDGGSITRGNVTTEWLSIAPEHFFARGRIIALYIGSDRRLITDLASVLGPTLDPNAPRGVNTREQGC